MTQRIMDLVEAAFSSDDEPIADADVAAWVLPGPKAGVQQCRIGSNMCRKKNMAWQKVSLLNLQEAPATAMLQATHSDNTTRNCCSLMVPQGKSFAYPSQPAKKNSTVSENMKH